MTMKVQSQCGCIADVKSCKVQKEGLKLSVSYLKQKGVSNFLIGARLQAIKTILKEQTQCFPIVLLIDRIEDVQNKIDTKALRRLNHTEERELNRLIRELEAFLGK